ncbi:hypothetical protein CV102_18065 [Natronococcus pandeyae]|uniref:CARDB domain-containing protein n=1 Tax=Natronococcus pandeyae TaxID=2055836 RepID=A0A8J8TNZ2_9EURY|nr:hypothetical protein CV102_18065 [Natronococcus pandeyae]
MREEGLDFGSGVGQAQEVEQIIAESYSEPGLATGISDSGETILFGFDDGNVMVFDEARDGAILPLAIDAPVSHIEVREETAAAALGWMDGDAFGVLDLLDGDGTPIEHPGMWDLSATADAEVASVSAPFGAPGSVVLADRDGTIHWETPLGDAGGRSVAITDNGSYVAVGAAQYDEGTDLVGNPGIRLYDSDGSEIWRHEHDEDVLAVGIDAERELVIGGADDWRTIALDFDGEVVWESDEFGGWIVLSADGGTVIGTEPGRTVAADATTGDQWWAADLDLGQWATGDVSLSADGSRVFAADRGDAAFTVLDDGEPLWTESHDVGPGRGALSGDGETWSTIVTDLDEDAATVAGYQIPEPEPAISVVDTDLSATDVEIDDTLELEATVENTGEADGTQTVELRVNDEVVDEVEIEVAAGTTETVTFSQTFDERGEFEVAIGDVVAGTVTVTDPAIQRVVDFDWAAPDCPDEDVGELDQYFVGDLGEDGFHLDDGGGAEEEPDGCVLRTDAEEAAIFSLSDGHVEQSDTLEHYPERGETIRFDHYVHRPGANMEFRFGVQADLESYYAVRLDTEEEPAALTLRRLDEGEATDLEQEAELAYTAGEFHTFEIDWRAAEITVTLVQDTDESTTLSASDDQYDDGGIGFYKKNAGIALSYTHLWEVVEVRQ